MVKERVMGTAVAAATRLSAAIARETADTENVAVAKARVTESRHKYKRIRVIVCCATMYFKRAICFGQLADQAPLNTIRYQGFLHCPWD